MNYLAGARIAAVLTVLVGAAFEGRADTIIGISGNEMVSPGIPVDALEMMDLGIDPGSFFFTGNTGYNYDGIYRVQVIGAEVDPGVTNSLDGIQVQKVLLTIGDAGNIGVTPVIDASGIVVSQATNPSAVPEPALTGTTMIAMLSSFWWYQRRRSGARRSLS